MQVALFAHSTNPRGGVVHALELAEALTELGHDATILAPDSEGRGFFRRTTTRQQTIPAARCSDLIDLVATRIIEIADHVLDHPEHTFDVWHAHCSITGNALARLKRLGRIRGFTRTVHHLDHFTDPRLAAWQRIGIEEADQVLTVSQRSQASLRQTFGIEAACIGNGVGSRFAPNGDDDGALRMRLNLSEHDAREPPFPIYLAVGGIEARKNTTAILRAFLRIHADLPAGRLIVAGGASLLDHSAARGEFDDVLARSDAADAVTLAGVIEDDAMPALYRIADAFVFPSLVEGFGLCPLEAMACGTPTIVSDTAPFNEHFEQHETIWANPHDVSSIEAAMRMALDPSTRARLSLSGPGTASRFAWSDVACRHLDLYRTSARAHA